MKISELLGRLQSAMVPIYGEQEARATAREIAIAEWGLSRTMLLVEPNAEVEVSEERLEQMCRELATARPWQYVVGREEFCGCEFEVAEGVLIPRPETEELVAWAVESLAGVSAGRAVDIGTGSGAIAVSLAHRLRGWSVEAVDLSEEALAIAGRNAERLGADVAMRKVDILREELAADSYDLIISNPPYIPEREKDMMRANVLDHEPHLALFVPDGEPLLFYERIARGGLQWLREGGLLMYEVHESYGTECCDMLAALGYEEIELRFDINHKPRMIRCRRPHK